MSHFTTLQTRLTAREDLLAALRDLGYAPEVGALRIRGYAGQTTPVEIAVKTDQPGYDLGFRRAGDSYELVADWYGLPDLDAESLLRQVTQRYACRAALRTLGEQGFSLASETVADDGGVHLVLRRLV